MIELSQAEVDEMLSTEVVGRVGCQLDGRVYVVPVIYAWDGECVYVQSIEGLKIEMMRANPRVCFEVDRYGAGGAWRSVIVEGTYEELPGASAARVLELLAGRFAGRRNGREPGRTGRAPVAFRIRPASVTGRRVGAVVSPRLAARLVRRLRRRVIHNPKLV